MHKITHPRISYLGIVVLCLSHIVGGIANPETINHRITCSTTKRPLSIWKINMWHSVVVWHALLSSSYRRLIITKSKEMKEKRKPLVSCGWKQCFGLNVVFYFFLYFRYIFSWKKCFASLQSCNYFIAFFDLVNLCYPISY